MISIAIEPGVSVAAGMRLGASVGTSVAVDEPAGMSVGTALGEVEAAAASAEASVAVASDWTTSAFPPPGLAISTGAQRFSCEAAGDGLMLFTKDASAGLVNAKNTIMPTNTRPAPTINAGRSQLGPCRF